MLQFAVFEVTRPCCLPSPAHAEFAFTSFCIQLPTRVRCSVYSGGAPSKWSMWRFPWAWSARWTLFNILPDAWWSTSLGSRVLRKSLWRALPQPTLPTACSAWMAWMWSVRHALWPTIRLRIFIASVSLVIAASFRLEKFFTMLSLLGCCQPCSIVWACVPSQLAPRRRPLVPLGGCKLARPPALDCYLHRRVACRSGCSRHCSACDHQVKRQRLKLMKSSRRFPRVTLPSVGARLAPTHVPRLPAWLPSTLLSGPVMIASQGSLRSVMLQMLSSATGVFTAGSRRVSAPAGPQSHD